MLCQFPSEWARSGAISPQPAIQSWAITARLQKHFPGTQGFVLANGGYFQSLCCQPKCQVNTAPWKDNFKNPHSLVSLALADWVATYQWLSFRLGEKNGAIWNLKTCGDCGECVKSEIKKQSYSEQPGTLIAFIFHAYSVQGHGEPRISRCTGHTVTKGNSPSFISSGCRTRQSVCSKANWTICAKGRELKLTD